MITFPQVGWDGFQISNSQLKFERSSIQICEKKFLGGRRVGVIQLRSSRIDIVNNKPLWRFAATNSIGGVLQVFESSTTPLLMVTVMTFLIFLVISHGSAGLDSEAGLSINQY